MNKTNNVAIADTSALISLLIENDANHEIATQSLTDTLAAQVTMVTPSDVFTETVNTLGKKFGREVAIEAANYILSTPGFLVVEALETYPQALEKFRTGTGSPSFTDCVVMAIADKYQTKQVFGFDECFSKSNYQIPSL